MQDLITTWSEEQNDDTLSKRELEEVKEFEAKAQQEKNEEAS